MKNYYLYFLLLFVAVDVTGQTLAVPQVIQEQDQWCWAGVTKAVLDYYGYPKMQCEIAEYAREVITWTSFGTTDCCTDASQGCNYWNYNWGTPGSIQDILVHFGAVQNYGYGGALPLTNVATEIANGRPFIARWGWTTGGGHFVVGQGVNGSDVAYMNPWFGEGYHISTYNWLVNDGNHTWTHTNVLSTNLAVENFGTVANDLALFPNPVQTNLNIVSHTPIQQIKLFDTNGRLLKTYEALDAERFAIDMTTFSSGVYFMAVTTADQVYYKKIVKE